VNLLCAVSYSLPFLGFSFLNLERFKFFLQGPQPLDQGNALFRHFSGENILGDKDLYMANLHINLLAVCLGVPESVNPVYHRIFAPASNVRSYRGPGSNWNTAVDCGYVTDDEGKMGFGPIKLGGSQLYQMAVATMVGRGRRWEG
jgi:hypothetical protein